MARRHRLRTRTKARNGTPRAVVDKASQLDRIEATLRYLYREVAAIKRAVVPQGEQVFPGLPVIEEGAVEHTEPEEEMDEPETATSEVDEEEVEARE